MLFHQLTVGSFDDFLVCSRMDLEHRVVVPRAGLGLSGGHVGEILSRRWRISAASSLAFPVVESRRATSCASAERHLRHVRRPRTFAELDVDAQGICYDITDALQSNFQEPVVIGS